MKPWWSHETMGYNIMTTLWQTIEDGICHGIFTNNEDMVDNYIRGTQYWYGWEKKMGDLCAMSSGSCLGFHRDMILGYVMGLPQNYIMGYNGIYIYMGYIGIWSGESNQQT
jgi:hypothetical protein